MRRLSRPAAALQRLVRDAREFQRFRRRRVSATPLRLPFAGGRLDEVRVYPDHVVAVEGWAPRLSSYQDGLSLLHNGVVHTPTHVFRVERPDIVGSSSSGFFGVIAEFVLDSCDPAVLRIASDPLVSVPISASGAPPPYAHLRTQAEVLHREHIYGSGPPVGYVSGEVLRLAKLLPAPILDFGCGAGALVAALRRDGIEAYGIELADTRIQSALLDDARPHVTLYDGALPLPLASRSMASVVATEVLEHIAPFDAVLNELVRVAQAKLLITVPDSSAIPRCAAHHVVPWHLLEATHVNFFTQHSLEAHLWPLAQHVEMARIGAVRCDTTVFYTSLAATVTIR